MDKDFLQFIFNIYKNYFFSDIGKALQLKTIIVRVCGIEVSENYELLKFCCRSCHDKVLRLNNN